MRRVDLLIAQIRKATENSDFSDTSGIDDTEFLQALNDAQQRLQSLIVAAHPKVFVKEKEYTAVTGQEAYDLPSNIFLDNKVTNVDYSHSGTLEDYYNLAPIVLKQRPNFEGEPSSYIRKSGQILLAPIPQNSGGKIRINYVKRIDELDKRRAIVSSATTSGSEVTSLVLDTASASVPIDSNSLNEHEHLCIVDRKGNILMRNIPFTNIDTGSGVVTIEAGFEFEDGETIPSGSYVVGGEDTTTHSELPRNCERYLLSYGAWKILKRDSSADFSEQQAELLAMEEDIKNSYGDITDDVTYVPRLTSFYDWE